MEKTFIQLKAHLGSHKKASMFLGLSYTRYNEWRRRPAEIPVQGRRLMEFALFKLNHSNPRGPTKNAKSDDFRHFIPERKR